MHQLGLSTAVALACLFMLCACIHEANTTFRSIRGSVDPARLADENACILKTRYSDEWQFNLGAPVDQPPLRGLALSGGGVRSASFSIGVLAALQDVLCRIDLLSSVSGGGYAASWLYTQALTNDFNIEALFRDGKYQCYLANHGEIVSHAPASATCLRRAEYGLDFVVTAVSWPVNLVVNGVFGWHANVVPMRRIYQNGLDRAYHRIPDKGSGSHSSPTLQLPDLCRVKGKLPFPVVNTTANLRDAASDEAGLLKNRVFEFTPLAYGSDYFGYERGSFPFDYNTAIAVSGAAADSKELIDPNAQMWASALNVDLGYFIDNPRAHACVLWKLLPYPLYTFTARYQRNYYGDHIYLADGGIVENLGAYGLVRRMCRRMLVVDAEYDPDFGFGAYWKLKKALRAEMGVDLFVGEIERLREAQEKFTGKTPVMLGTIGAFPMPGADPNAPDYATITVVYLKLSMDRDHIDNYPKEVRDYAKGHEDFPQRTTLDQSYTPDQYLAYRELGKYIVTTNRQEILRALDLN